MRAEAGEHVMAVLPDRLGHNERRVCGYIAEDFHAVFLAVDEAVAFRLVEGVSAFDRIAFLVNGGGQVLFEGLLGSLTFLIGGSAEIAAGDEIDGGGFWRHRVFGLYERS